MHFLDEAVAQETDDGGHKIIVTISGRVGRGAVRELRFLLNTSVAREHTGGVILDLTAVEVDEDGAALDSMAICAIQRFSKSLTERDIELIIVADEIVGLCLVSQGFGAYFSQVHDLATAKLMFNINE
jgi:anti-anti-sigma regulatory factor